MQLGYVFVCCLEILETRKHIIYMTDPLHILFNCTVQRYNSGLKKVDSPKYVRGMKYKGGVPLEEEFTPSQLLDRLDRNLGKKLGAVIDLTNTNRYYDSKVPTYVCVYVSTYVLGECKCTVGELSHAPCMRTLRTYQYIYKYEKSSCGARFACPIIHYGLGLVCALFGVVVIVLH